MARTRQTASNGALPSHTAIVGAARAVFASARPRLTNVMICRWLEDRKRGMGGDAGPLGEVAATEGGEGG